MLKRCRNCGVTFETERSRILCDDCKRRKVTNKPKAKKKGFSLAEDIPISDYVKIIKRYNEKYGLSYTYGQFIQKVNDGDIDIKREIRNAGLPAQKG